MIRHIGLLAFVALLLSCEKPTIAPPEIRWGVDECANCIMTIQEEASACAAVRISSEGRLEVRSCDDVNCLVELLDEQGDFASWTVFVHDHASHAWLPATSAKFVRDVQIKTPMASGVAAYGTGAPNHACTWAEMTAQIRNESTVHPKK